MACKHKHTQTSLHVHVKANTLTHTHTHYMTLIWMHEMHDQMITPIKVIQLICLPVNPPFIPWVSSSWQLAYNNFGYYSLIFKRKQAKNIGHCDGTYQRSMKSLYSIYTLPEMNTVYWTSIILPYNVTSFLILKFR